MGRYELGTGHIAIMPSFKGFRGAVGKEMRSAAGAGGRQFAAGLAGLGKTAGARIAGDISKATASVNLRGLKKQVADAAAGVARARAVDERAAGQLRVAETALADARARYAAGSVQVVRAEERAAEARRRHQRAVDGLAAATDKHKRFQGELNKLLAAPKEAPRVSFASQLLKDIAPLRGELRGLSGVVSGFGKAGGNVARTMVREFAPVGGQIAAGIRPGFAAVVQHGAAAARDVANSFKSVGGVAATAITGALAVSVKGGFDRLASFELAEAKMRGLGFAAADVKKVMADVRKSVKGTAYSSDEMAVAVSQAMASGLKPGAELNRYMNMLKNTAAASGAPLRDIQSVFGEILANGRAYAGDIKQLTNRGIPVYELLEQKLGKTNEQIKAMVSNGEITAEVLTDVLGESLANMADEVGGTTVAALANMRSSFTRFGAELQQELFPFVGRIAGAVQSVVEVAIAALPFLKKAFGLEDFGGGLAKIDSFTDKMNDLAELISGGGAGIEAMFSSIADRVKELAPVLGLAAAAAVPLMGSFLSGLPVIGGLFAGLGSSLLGGFAPLLAAGGLVAMIGLDPAQFSAVIESIVSGITTMVPALIDSVVSLLENFVPQLVQNLLANVPILLNGAVTLLTSLVKAAATALPQVISAVVQLVPQLINSLVGLIPVLVDGIVPLFLGILDALTIAIPQVLTAVIDAVPQIVTSLLSALPVLLEGAVTLFLGLIEGLGQALPQIITAVIDAVPKLLQALISQLPLLIETAVRLFLGLVEAIPRALPQIVNAVIGLIPAILQALWNAIPQLVNAGWDLLRGLANGIANAGHLIFEAIGNVVNGAIGWAKNLLGIKSPSRVFAGIGRDVGRGMAVGIESMSGQVAAAAGGLANAAVDAARDFQAGVSDLEVRGKMDKPHKPAAGGLNGGHDVTVNVYTNDVEAAARKVAEKLRM